MKQIQSKKTFKQLFLLLSLFNFSVSQGYSQSSWASKVSAASNAGASAISSVMDAVTSLLMAIAAVAFLIGIVNAGFKYKSGDQQAFKNLQGVLMGSLIVLIGVGLAKVLFF